MDNDYIMVEDRKKWLNEYFDLLLNSRPSPQNKHEIKSKKMRRLRDLKYLYRYIDVEKTRKYVINPLQDGKKLNIRPSHPSKFNDPFDTRLPLEYFKHPKMRLQYARELQEIICKYSNWKSEYCDECWAEFEISLEIKDFSEWKKKICEIFLKYWPLDNPDQELKNLVVRKITKYEEGAQKGLDNELGISCFSETPKSILMWSHYAQKHTGICLAYDTSIFLKDTRRYDIIDWLNPVRYMNDISDILSELKRKADGEYFSKEEDEILQYKSLLTKYDAWSYEMEWRLAFWFPLSLWGPNPEGDDDRYDLPLPVKCIYLGVNIADDLKTEIYNVSLQKGIEVKEMKIADNKFELLVRD